MEVQKLSHFMMDILTVTAAMDGDFNYSPGSK